MHIHHTCLLMVTTAWYGDTLFPVTDSMRRLTRAGLTAILILLGLSCVPVIASAQRVDDDALVNALEYAREKNFLPLEFVEHPSPYRILSRLDFTLGVIDHYYAREHFRGCFRNIAASLPVHYTHLFRDVPITAPYAPKLCVAIHAGLIDGEEDGSFRPEEPITVAEAAKILAKAHGLIYPSKFSSDRPWYEPSMRALQHFGGLSPSVRPTSIVTAGDAALLVYELRNQERYPAKRIISGIRQPTIQAEWTPAEQPTFIAADTPELQSAPPPSVITRTGTKISRRSLLKQERQRSAERTSLLLADTRGG